MTETDSLKSIKEHCIRLLSRREHSQQELHNKLAVKGFERFDIQIEIDRLAEQDWQSDQRFAESYCRYRIKKGFGPIKIGYELQQRGIYEFNIDPVALDLADSWIEILEQVYAKKFDASLSMTKNEWLKRCRFLQQRGFDIEMIQTLFRQLNLYMVYS